MKDKVISDYRKLSVDDKKKIILDELLDNISVVEKLCQRKKLQFAKVRKDDALVDKTLLSESEFLDLLYEYVLVLRENNSALLVDLLK
jgi:hypothetical protein